MKEYLINLTLNNKDENEVQFIKLFVPTNMSLSDIYTNIYKEHEYLDSKRNSIYKINGRNIISLLYYVCEKYGWKWKPMEANLNITLD